jgi:hypothetical protein
MAFPPFWSGTADFFAVPDLTDSYPLATRQRACQNATNKIGKPVILLAQDVEDVPFDLRHIRMIRYTQTPEGMLFLRESLSKALRAVAG